MIENSPSQQWLGHFQNCWPGGKPGVILDTPLDPGEDDRELGQEGQWGGLAATERGQDCPLQKQGLSASWCPPGASLSLPDPGPKQTQVPMPSVSWPVLPWGSGPPTSALDGV